ncbi:YybH family protein [Streptodolium elevatio]
MTPTPDATTETADATAADRDAADRRSETEIRDLHHWWFAHTAGKDLDAMIADSAEDVVAYEQETPLRHTGVADLRTTCKAGLDAAGDATVHWDVPDLTVAARDDLAVAWGLDRIRLANPGGSATEAWSRATRVFTRRGGHSRMTHQHLSVPYDGQTARAALDLTP